MGKIIQTAGRNALGEFAPEFAHFNDWSLRPLSTSCRSGTQRTSARK